MAVTLAVQSGKAKYGIQEYYLDTPSDLVDLMKINTDLPGSKAVVISTGDKYVQNSQGQWVLQPVATGGGGGSGGAGTPGVSIIGVSVDAQNNLTCTMSNGTTIEAGQIKTQPGTSIKLVAIDAKDHLIITLSDGSKIDAGLLPAGPAGKDGADGVDGKDGEKGEKGDPFTYEDFTPEQLEELRGPEGKQGPAGQDGAAGKDGAKGEKGDKGDPFTYDDFTVEQLEELRGPEGRPGPAGEDGQKGDKGDPFTYDDFTPEQLEQLRGPTGPAGRTPVKGEDYWTEEDKKEIIDSLPSGGTGEGIVYTAGDGINIVGDTINITTPVKNILTQNEFDILSEEEKNKGLYFISDATNSAIGGSLMGSVPIGTIISFMGTQAPDEYLICDGTTYNIQEYNQLFQFFQKQFGIGNYFGGDGVSTFAIPDLRNLFLRGFHGEAEEALSGEIGERQEGTHIPSMYKGVGSAGNYYIGSPINRTIGGGYVEDQDSAVVTATETIAISSTPGAVSSMVSTYTSRPVNAAVLYCIKAVESAPASSGGASEEVYSTEETRIGTWMGKPLYRKAYEGLTPSESGSWANTIYVPDVDTVVSLFAVVKRAEGKLPLNFSTYCFCEYRGEFISFYSFNNSFLNLPVTGYMEYTKTTD